MSRSIRKGFLFNHYPLKRGTCLAKVYLNYHRFSEDLDFTWKKQEVFKGKTMKKIRKVCSELINEIGREIKDIS
ncbi:MAG: nucleotidyl transferase AbiEii/AbiGii toxin family protein, partial [Methanosarcinales archaeon]